MKIFLLNIIIILLIVNINIAVSFEESVLEDLLERISEETGSSPELDAIEQLIENPIYLKSTSIGNFLRIPGFLTSEAKAIVELSSIDSITSFNQIYQIIELSDDQKYLLEICSTFDYVDKKNSIYYRSRFKEYLNDVRGFEQGIFLGNRLDYYQRFSIYKNEFSGNILTDKDAGEIKLFDNLSANIEYDKYGLKIIVGDYLVETGLGNILWKKCGYSKGADVITPALRFGTGIHPYRSSIDYGFFRGLASQYDYTFWGINFRTIFWFSNLNKPGSSNATEDTITSVYTSGYYRTDSEISKKYAFNENALGANLEIKYKQMKIGGSLLNINNSKIIQSEAKTAFLGRNGYLSSIYSMLDFESLSLAAEASFDAGGNFGFKGSTQLYYDYFDIAINMRSYSPHFRSPFGYNFGESYAVNNEYGVYFGFKFKGMRHFILSTYLDMYASYIKTFTVPKPIRGNDLFVQCEWKINSGNNFIFRIHQEQKTDAKTLSEQNKVIFQKNIFRVRGEYKLDFTKYFNSRLRAEAVYVKPSKIISDEKGLAGFAEINWIPFDYLKTGIRYSLFSTDSFESVVWQYEMAVPGYMSTISLYGSGFRSFIYAKYTLMDIMDLCFRYSITHKKNVESIGSGYLEISGQNDQRIIFQIDLKL